MRERARPRRRRHPAREALRPACAARVLEDYVVPLGAIVRAKPPGAAATVSSVRVGAMVRCKVLKQLPNGLFVSFWGPFVGRIHYDSLPAGDAEGGVGACAGVCMRMRL